MSLWICVCLFFILRLLSDFIQMSELLGFSSVSFNFSISKNELIDFFSIWIFLLDSFTLLMVPYHSSPSDPVQHFDHFWLLSFSLLHPVSLQVHLLWSFLSITTPTALSQSLIIPLWNIAVTPKLTSIVCLLSLQPILYISAQLFSKREVYHFSPAQTSKINNFLKAQTL